MTSISKPDPQSTLQFNAEKFNPLIGLLLFLFVVFVAVAIWGYFNGKGLMWQAPGGVLFFLVFYYTAFAGWRVEVDPEIITVVTFFLFRKTVQRSAITSWAVKTGWKGGDRIKSVPYSRLEIYTSKNAQPFMIPTKPLRREDYQTLVSILPDAKKGKKSATE